MRKYRKKGNICAFVLWGSSAYGLSRIALEAAKVHLNIHFSVWGEVVLDTVMIFLAAWLILTFHDEAKGETSSRNVGR